MIELGENVDKIQPEIACEEVDERRKIIEGL